MVLELSTRAIIISKIFLIILSNINKKDKILLNLKYIFKLAENYNMELDDFVYFYNIGNIFIRTKMFKLVHQIYIDDTKVILFDSNLTKYNNTIFYFHGGGYCAGSPEIYYDFLKKIDKKIKTNANYILIDYKKIPDYNLDQIINSTYNIYNNLAEGINENIIFMGDSAGANLALQVTNLCVKNNKNIPKDLILLSPWLISDNKSKYWNENLDKDYLTPYTINLAEYSVLNSYDYSDFNPLNFNYDNFPNILIRAGSHELILDEIYSLIDKVTNSKCNIETQIVKNMYHSFDLYYSFSKSESPDYDKLINYLNSILK